MFLKRQGIKKNHAVLIEISDPNYKNTWLASLDQKVYSIIQSLRPAAITFCNRPTAKGIFFKLCFTSYIVGPGI